MSRRWVIPVAVSATMTVLAIVTVLAVRERSDKDTPKQETSNPPTALPTDTSANTSPVTTSAATASAPTATSAATASAPTATAWVTSASGEKLMMETSVDAREATNEDVVQIVIDPRVEGQEIDGFGAGMTHSSAELITLMPSDRRDALMAELFDPDGPIRLSNLRVPIGASDFISGEPFTFDDLPPGETDWNLERFSIDRDRESLVPVLLQALTINPELKIIASPWSPPAWLKTTASLQGGRLLDQPDAYRTYANYLVRFIQDYQSAGIPIAAVTVQNEPQLRHPAGYPGTDMPVHQQVALIEALGPQLQDAGLSTDILGFDHNWSLHDNDAATTPEGEDPAYQYPADVLRSPASRWLAGTAYHCYSGTATAQTELHNQFPDKGIWVTECSGSHGPGDLPEQIFAQTLQWQARNLLIDPLRNWAQAVLTWNLALDEAGGPHVGGCDTCTGVVTIHPDGSVTRNAEYYILAHASRFVAPTAIRIASQSTVDLPTVHVAFRNPDGSTVLIIYNSTDEPTAVSAGDSESVITTTVPARSLITVVWNDASH